MEQLFNFHVNPKSQREVTCSRRREYDLEWMVWISELKGN
jgi:hypothetical protein